MIFSYTPCDFSVQFKSNVQQLNYIKIQFGKKKKEKRKKKKAQTAPFGEFFSKSQFLNTFDDDKYNLMKTFQFAYRERAFFKK